MSFCTSFICAAKWLKNHALYRVAAPCPKHPPSPILSYLDIINSILHVANHISVAILQLKIGLFYVVLG